ncbi:CAP domain-containing protein [Arthrobacter sp. HY1533]|uniref:CAP domain-containing protein n=1 Tax=Arthrobacter sp. HY1533 TaxID=2970919 RepID=UPI0022B9DAA3|nr:CAP domain-containing protein [Arthrobacter sp. HY1533]
MRKHPGRIPALALTASLLLPGFLVSGAAPALAAPAAAESTAAPTPAAVPLAGPTANATEMPAPATTPPATAASTTPPEATAQPVPSMEPTGSVATPTAPVPAPDKAGRGIAAPYAAAPYAAAASSDPYLVQVLALINNRRAASGAGPLVWNATIATGSQQWAATLNTRLNKDGNLNMGQVHRPDAGLSILPKGADMYSEIIGINYTPANIVDWWMGSPAHKAAMLDKRATDIGIGQVQTTKSGWGGMRIVVANLAGYESSRVNQPQPTPTPTPTPGPVAVANDGDVAAIDSAGNLFIYGSANGADLWKRTFVSGGWAGVAQLELIDFNSDGRQDIVGKWADGRLTLSLGQANGTLAATRQIGWGWGNFDIIATKWRMSDKYPGIVAKQRLSGELFHYASADGSALAMPSKIGVGWGPLTIIAVEFDGDGRTDLAARNAAGQLILYRGNGVGGFMDEPRKVIGTGWGSMTHLSGISNHLGTKAWGVLARDGAGNLHHYAILKDRFGTRSQIGTGGWQTLLLGS